MTMRQRAGSLAFILLTFFSLLSRPAGAAGVVEDRGTLRATVGGGQVLTFSSPVKRVAVAEDSLVAIHLVSDREVLLNGMRPGVTTLFIWLQDDRRVRYVLRVGPNVDFVASALREIDPRISVETSPDGSSVILRGDVADARTARVAKQQAEILLRGSKNDGGVTTVLNLLRFPGLTASAEDRLQQALETVDPRIQVRRIQVGAEPDAERDSFVLEGNVRTLSDLQRAITLAERQLGGTGIGVKVADDDRISFNRYSGANLSGMGGGVNGNGLQALQGANPIATGLAAKLSRGLVVTSQSGRVISFLDVDEISQVMVSIRVLEVNRGKARKMGINFRLDTEHISIGNYTGPQLPPTRVNGANAIGLAATSANLVASFVDKATSILTAIDFLDSKNLVRSVAEPNILTLSGEAATVLVGGEVPIPTSTSNNVSTFQGVFFQNFGVRLDIRPTVDPNGVVTLEVAPSIVRPDAGLAVGGVPGFQIQTVQTVARVVAGESLVLGGLLTFEEGVEQRGLPGLQKIPIFRWKNQTHEEEELLFVITPKLMGNASETAKKAELPALEWPEDRGQWIEALPAPKYGQDGVPESFEPAPEPAVVAPAPAPEPAPVESEPAPPPASAALKALPAAPVVSPESLPLEPSVVASASGGG